MLMKILTVALVVVLIVAILYFLMIMPRMMGRPDKTPFMDVLYAHRGLHDNESEAPENSMAAFRKAVEGGYGIELDVQLTKDQVPVVFHDFTLQRMARMAGDVAADSTPTGDGSKTAEAAETADAIETAEAVTSGATEDRGLQPAPGKVADYTYEELKRFTLGKSSEQIPTFKEFLEMVDGRVPLIVEYKIPGINNVKVCELGNELLSSYKGLYCIESFNPLAVRWYKKNNPKVMRGQLAENFLKEKQSGYPGIVFFAMHHLLLNFLAKPDFIAYNHKHYKDWSRSLCRYLYKGVAVAYTIKSQQQLEDRSGDFDMFIFDSFVPEGGSKNVAKR